MDIKASVGRRVAIVAAAFAVVVGGGVFGYLEVFTKGLDRLPERPCTGAVARSTVKQILPDARSAEERGRSTDQGRDFVFFCRVLTSDDHIVSGESELQDATTDEWLSGYEQEAGDTYGQLREAAGRKGVKTLTLDRLASVYMPCSIAGGSAKRSLRQYALITEARVIGESRVQGNELREALTEFAVQMSEHAYTVGECNKA